MILKFLCDSGIYKQLRLYDVPLNVRTHTMLNLNIAFEPEDALKQYNAQNDLDRRQAKKTDEKKADKINEASENFFRLNQAKKFIKVQPMFYDKSGIWWMWNFEKFCYEMTDEVDILNGINKALNMDTTKSKIKTEILNALKQMGRENIPQAAEKTWVQFKDVIVDVKTGEQFKSSPKYFITNPIPWEIGESEETPTMDKYFKEWVVMEGLQDETYIKTLYQHIAYSTLADQFLQRLFAYTGSGSNGKGVFLSLLEKFLGEDNICTTELKILATKQFESSALYKKQAVFMTEVDVYDMQNTNLLKKLTGEDNIRYEFKGKTPFKESSSTTSFIATNSLPVTPDKSIAFYRRYVKEIAERMRKGKISIRVLEEYLPMEIDIGNRMLVLAISHVKMSTGIVLRNPAVKSLYSTLFDQKLPRTRNFLEYL